VYRAKDTKLGRDVALKFLSPEFASDRERMARLEREARVLASLNHPNIAQIYGLEESGGMRFLVLELVEGEALADRLRRGPIPIEEALEIAKQIAEGVEAAHEKDITHRDLKPANIKITPDGKVKVLDFELAKALTGETTGAVSPDSPTLLSGSPTEPNVILGTAAYMSPEQARGKVADERSDIWGFGCVLYEMLSRKVAFGGESMVEILEIHPESHRLDRQPETL
jgi:serine/threonine protein kinase